MLFTKTFCNLYIMKHSSLIDHIERRKIVTLSSQHMVLNLIIGLISSEIAEDIQMLNWIRGFIVSCLRVWRQTQGHGHEFVSACLSIWLEYTGCSMCLFSKPPFTRLAEALQSLRLRAPLDRHVHWFQLVSSNIYTCQMLMGASNCQWGGFVDWNVWNIPGGDRLALRYRPMLWPNVLNAADLH